MLVQASILKCTNLPLHPLSRALLACAPLGRSSKPSAHPRRLRRCSRLLQRLVVDRNQRLVLDEVEREGGAYVADIRKGGEFRHEGLEGGQVRGHAFEDEV